jgi:hypothetical protein
MSEALAALAAVTAKATTGLHPSFFGLMRPSPRSSLLLTKFDHKDSNLSQDSLRIRKRELVIRDRDRFLERNSRYRTSTHLLVCAFHDWPADLARSGRKTATDLARS